MDYDQRRIHVHELNSLGPVRLFYYDVNMQNSVSLGPDGLGMCCNIRYI